MYVFEYITIFSEANASDSSKTWQVTQILIPYSSKHLYLSSLSNFNFCTCKTSECWLTFLQAMESPAKRPVSKIAVEGMCITHVPSCVSCKIYLAILG